MTDASGGPAFSLHEIPFSHHGSWFDISPVIGEHTYAEDLHLVSHQNGMHPVLRLTPPAGAHWQATPGQLSWVSEAGRIDLAYETPDTLRLRGRGLGLRLTAVAPVLTPFSGTYLYRDPVDGAFTFTSYETGRRYRLTVLTGAVQATGVEALGEGERGVLLDGEWEAAIEELDSAREPYSSTAAFEKIVASAGAAFADFVDAIAPWRTAGTPAADLAAYVLWSATVRPAGLVGRPAVLMSKHWMDKVWSWDHCFNALALAAGAPELALDQFLLPFDHQDESGALPDSVTHSEVLYNFVKPPIHGWTLRLLRERLPEPLSSGELSLIYRSLAAWTRFWLRLRRAPGSALAHYQHGNDSGWDNATVFDAGRIVVSPDLAAFLTLQLGELAATAAELGRPDEAVEWSRAAADMHQALFAELWDGERFLARSADTGEPRATASLLHLLVVVLGADLPPEARAVLSQQISAHLTAFGLATEHPDSPHYQQDGYWRGPIWAPATVLVEDGLRRAGHTALADEISARFLALCERSGFAENFDALSGEGLRDRAYTWTAAAYLLLAEAAARRSRAAD
ncbi:glycogen debranching protein [Streptacidiphilus pinicola]|uniref:Glycogen debranching protein n=1 Tax=Streptacidiphilus pinicola TaxID=2219663 RepID=A0A2X0ISX2_9ACTN|nr:trehalase family glycosidase [Streptacidiphilus pinicola]RAG86683.1 glycogen debranching protein [Streptacidiphilus pinicola]